MWSILGLLLACSPSTRRGDHTITGYNYDKFSTDDYEFEQIAGPVPGQKAPDFELTTPSGNKCRLLDIKGDFLVLEMGSITCPLFQSRRGIMGRLSQDFPGVASSVLYVREAHPGAAIPSHRNFEEKQEAARRLKDEDGEGRLILVDDFDGAAHRAYGSMPNAVYIINRNGCVVFRADWNNPSATRKAIAALVKGREIRIKSYFLPPTPTTALRTLRRAGAGAVLDFLRGLPFLIWTNLIKRNLRLLMGRPHRLSRDTTC